MSKKIGILYLVVLIAFTMSSAYLYQNYRAQLQMQYQPILEFVHPYPYFDLWYGKVELLLILCAVPLLMVAYKSKKQRLSMNTIAIAMLMLFMCVCTVPPTQAYLWTGDDGGGSRAMPPVPPIPYVDPSISININTLMKFDEECTDWGWRKDRWEMCFVLRWWLKGWNEFLDPYTKFKNTYNLLLTPLEGWDTFWTSNNYIHNAYNLLQQAIKDNGGTYIPAYNWYAWKPKQVLLTNGSYAWCDYLFFFTSQDIGMYGLSVPWWNATICSMSFPYTSIPIHEIAHQFYVTDCGNVCVMNEFWASVPCFTWCSACHDTIMNNRGKYVTKS